MAIFASAGALRAHDPGLSTAEISLRPDSVEITVGLSPRDACQLLPHQSTRLEASDPRAIQELSTRIAKDWCELTRGGAALALRGVAVDTPTADSVRFHLTFPRIEGAMATVRLPKLAELPVGHREFVIVTDSRGAVVTKKFLTAADSMLQFESPQSDAATAPPVRPFLGFIKLGIEHIWTGYDHLLFLFALLVVCRTFRSILGIISCFTLAHSLTLAAATLGWVNLPSRLVEPAIAASIVFVGVENVLRRGAEPAGRWVLTFMFGLIHGFGFASALRDLGVGASRGGVALPLFTFNLGVEIGQIAVALLALPLVWQLRKGDFFVRRGVPAISTLVAGAGAYWLLVRTVFA